MRQGGRVEASQGLVTFDDQQLLADLEQGRANLEKMKRGFRPEEIAEVRAAAAQAKADYEQRSNGYRREEIAAAQADVERTRADAVRAERNLKRADDLPNQGIFPRQ